MNICETISNSFSLTISAGGFSGLQITLFGLASKTRIPTATSWVGSNGLLVDDFDDSLGEKNMCIIHSRHCSTMDDYD